MTSTARFQFYGNLNDFLPAAKKQHPLEYSFSGSPSVKDAIEALGIPHPEVAALLVNGAPVGFSYLLQPQDQVQVYPSSLLSQVPGALALQERLPAPVAFILDVHLGKLARNLRLLGFDALYRNDYNDAELAQRAAQEDRIVLTRDVGLLKQKTIRWGYWLRSQFPEEQLQDVVLHFKLRAQLRPFSRCLACNGSLQPVTKEAVLEKLPPKTRLYFEEFYQCRACERVYWKGSHYDRMQNLLQQLSSGWPAPEESAD